MRYQVFMITALVGVIVLSGCGGSSSSQVPANQSPLATNWQWTLYDASGSTPPAQGGITGGFLQNNGNSVTGSLAYAIYAGPNKSACAGGSAPVTGTVDGQSVKLTVAAGGQTYTFEGTLATTANGSTITGTYMSTDGSPLAGGGTCGTGTGQQSLNWNAVSVSPLTGAFQGSFHSQALGNQDFAVTGALTEGENTGADYATVTGTLSIPGYPCFTQAGLNGTISGSSLILSIIGPNGLDVGSIGTPSQNGAPPAPATVQLGTTGRLLLSVHNGTGSGSGGYQVTTGPCPLTNPNGGSAPGDFGNVCLGLGTAADCNVLVSFSPATLTFPPQVLGTMPSTQTVTLTNTDPLGQPQTLTLALGSTLTGVYAGLAGVGDFNGQPNYTEQDTCGSSPFTLAANQSCTIYISFSPQESCPWPPDPNQPSGASPVQCPITLPAFIQATTNSSVDGNNAFIAPMAGMGLSAIAASPSELDFGEEDPSVGEESDSQSIVFTNQAPYPVEILPAAPCVGGQLPDPLVPGVAPGLQVVSIAFPFQNDRPHNVCYASEDVDDFPVVVDNCSGVTLQPQQVCTLGIASKPHLNPQIQPPVYLELNTLQCVFPELPSSTNPCEIDAGRFPVVLTAQGHSDSLRMIPAAGITFATQAVGTTSAPQTITLLNDPNDSNPAPLTFIAIVANGDYAQTNTCGSGLTVGQSCNITVTFTPTHTGLRQGSVVITMPLSQPPILLRGRGE